MSFSDFIDREWTVVDKPEPGPEAKHTTGDVVTFEGTEDAVIIRCKRYADGRYDPDKDQIVVGDYMITITTSPEGKDHRIVFARKSEDQGPFGGSWTAEDMSNQPGDGE
jgi:hypothetical protein